MAWSRRRDGRPDDGLSIRFLEPGWAVTAEAVFGRINATVVDGRIRDTHVG